MGKSFLLAGNSPVKIIPFLFAVESHSAPGCVVDTVSTLPLSCSALAHQASMWLAALGYFFHPCTFAFCLALTSRLGLRVFPPAAFLIAVRSVIASQDQSGMQHEQAAQHTTHAARSKVILGSPGLWGR